MPLLTLLLLWCGLLACTGADKDSDPVDADGDGYTQDEDCDDDDEDVNPGSAEVCDEKDNDCDDATDENVAGSYFMDADLDGFGDADAAVKACSLSDGLATNDEDCDDDDDAVNPDAVEICNTIDDDCDEATDEDVQETFWSDADGDGWGDEDHEVLGCELEDGLAAASGDCDDGDPDVSPGADELCDEIDNDCDSLTDESTALDARSWYADTDRDSYGDPLEIELSCEMPEGYVANDDDCDDGREDAYPDAPEYCDGFDNDCDDASDESTALDAATWYVDADEDGFGDASSSTQACDDPGSTWSLDADDCDDSDADVNPDADEVCDTLDNDCDGDTDEDGATDAPTWYVDVDGDGYGDAATSQVSCEQPSGYVSDDSDCDDADSGTYDGADEVCDSADNDCDGTTDEAAIDASTWFADVDADGYGDAGSSVNSCSEPVGYVADDSDCDDADDAISPAEIEVCDSADNDCDGDTDEDGAYDASDWYADVDLDGFGDPDSTATTSCSAPSSAWSTDTTDCDDGDAAINPDADELCDDADNDCDGTTDEDGATDATSWYLDVDGDGFGDSTVDDVSCEQPSGYVEDATDCDDGDSGAWPGAAEYCDEVDNDCDGSTDEAAVDTTTFYADVDGDGFGDATATFDACELPTGYSTDDADCDDADAAISPAEDEVCDSVDNDCDGDTDEDSATDALTWFTDADGDGYGDPDASTQEACSTPGSGWSGYDSDCDDGDATISPDEDELCDEVDNDCDGDTDEDGATDALTFYIDSDGDGYGGSNTTAACELPSGYTATSGDCDDSDAGAWPSATEYCDGVDNDCDSTTDENATDDATWYADDDGDGYGDAADSTEACSQPSGYVRASTDCDDADSGISPGATETCDGEDDDCDGDTDEDGAADASTWYADSDSDGYGDDDTSAVSCSAPSGYVATAGDCDDDDSAINEDEDEVCDDADNDCDGDTDESDAVDILTWYRDSDGDGYGRNANTTVSCDEPSGYAAVGGDCIDSDASTNPGATETCDGNDDDCDGTTDEEASDATTWYADSDSDGYGDADNTQASCSRPSSYTSNASDCDDSDASIKPGGTEYCDDVDEDCDGTTDEDAVDATTFYADDDGDGYGDATDTLAECDLPSGYADNGSDCDDTDAERNPDTIWYADSDKDGYGDPSNTRTQCSQPGANWVLVGEDCEPANATAYPEADESCFDSVDNDCDGTTDEDCPTEHCGTITSDETWSASEEHTVTCDVYVCGTASPLLTLEDGVTVEFQDNTELYVGTSCGKGSLEVTGTSSGVTLTSDDGGSAAAGDWGALYIGNNDQGSLIEGLTIEYAGASHAGAIYLYQADVEITDTVVQYSSSAGIYVNAGTLLLADSLVSDNDSDGVYLTSSAALSEVSSSTFSGNVITDNDGYPVVVPANYVDELDSSSSYVGNTDDSIYVHADDISDDATWQALDVDYLLLGNTYVRGASRPELTLSDGVSLYFDSAARLIMGQGNYGTLDATGSTAGILFTSAEASPAAGDWGGLTFGPYADGSYLEGVTVEYGGNTRANVHCDGGDIEIVDSLLDESSKDGVYAASATLSISGTTISNSAQDGVYLDSGSALDGSTTPSFVDNVLTDNGGYPIRLPAEHYGELDASSSFSGNGDDYIYAWADTVTSDATWQALDAPYFIAGDVNIAGSSRPEVTIEGGTTFYVNYSTALSVGASNYGGLFVEGTNAAPVVFTSIRSTPRAGDWDGLTVSNYDLGSEFSFTTFEYAGGNGLGNVYLYRSSPMFDSCTFDSSTVHGLYGSSSSAPLIVDSSFVNSDNSGIYLASGAGLDTSATPGFSGNEMTNNGEYPLLVPANFLGELAADNVFSGNNDDYIYVYNDTVDTDATWEAHDVPYLFAGSVYVQDSSRPVVTVSEGATLLWEYYAELYVGYGSYGGLVVDGSAALPVTFTSAQASPNNGDWRGIRFGSYCEDTYAGLTYAEVSYGGDNGYGNVFFDQCDGYVTSSESAYSSNYGIYRNNASPTLTKVTYTGNSVGDLY